MEIQSQAHFQDQGFSNQWFKKDDDGDLKADFRSLLHLKSDSVGLGWDSTLFPRLTTEKHKKEDEICTEVIEKEKNKKEERSFW